MRKWIKTADCIAFSVEDGVARITLNRPEKRNAISHQLLGELHDALLEADDLKAVRCIVLEGAGKDFCAGYDIITSYAAMHQQNTGGSSDGIDHSQYRGSKSFDDDTWQMERMLLAKMQLFDSHKPIIAKVQGNCLAGGTDLALLCDMVIADDDARIGFPATRSQGSPPNHMWFYHVGPQWAKRLLLSGDAISGKDAARIGLVMDSVPRAELDTFVDGLAKRIANVDAELLAANKRVVNIALELTGARTMQRMATEMDARAHLNPTLQGFRNDVAELGLKAALKRRDEPFGDGMVRLNKSD